MSSNDKPERGRLVSVFSTKGGCGKTTIATNLACALHAAGAGRVCLLDLDLASGDVATTLLLPAGRSLAAVLGRPQAAIADLVTRIRPGLDAILAPTGPGDAERLPIEVVADVLDRVAEEYDVVVVDTGTAFTAPVLAALDRSDKQVLITTPERPALLNLRRTLDALDLLGYARYRREIVFNRSDSQVGITLADVERVVRAPVSVHVPSSRDVPSSINRGVPLVDAAADHPVSLAIHRLVELTLRSPPGLFTGPAAPRRTRS